MGQAANADFISADSVAATSRYDTTTTVLDEEGLINGDGLDVLSAAGLHNGSFADLWHAGVATLGDSTGSGTKAANVAGQHVDFTFDTAVDLINIYIWNYSQSGISAGGRGVNTFDLYASITTDPNDLVQIGSTQSLTIGEFDGTEPVQTFGLVANNIRLVRLDILTDQGANTNNYVGLDEVHFEGEPVPEPTSFVLISLGLAAIGFASRRCRRRA
jgi:hypothetical protein